MARIFTPLLLLAGWIAIQPAQAALITGNIAVRSNGTNSVIGYLDLTGAGDRYLVGSLANANTFQLDTSASSPFSLTDQDAAPSHQFLAGLISPGIELRASNSNAAILGNSPVSTAAGSSPQSGGSVSIPGSEYESAIWSLSGSDFEARWVNHDGNQPPVTIIWDPVGQVLYLSANPAAVILNHPGSETVTLSFTGELTAAPEPSTFALLLSGVAAGLILRKRRFAHAES